MRTPELVRWYLFKYIMYCIKYVDVLVACVLFTVNGLLRVIYIFIFKITVRTERCDRVVNTVCVPDAPGLISAHRPAIVIEVSLGFLQSL